MGGLSLGIPSEDEKCRILFYEFHIDRWGVFRMCATCSMSHSGDGGFSLSVLC